MRVFAYIDGFNLYYRALRPTNHKWLDPIRLVERILDPADTVEAVRYFTARVSSRAGSINAPKKQQIYLSALGTLPKIRIHYGRFLPKTKRRPLVSDPTKFVEIHDTEEKGSDVNLAVHLINDGWHRRYDLALLLSQDSDLIEPVRLVTGDLKLKVGLVWLDGGNPSNHFKEAATFVRHVTKSDLSAAQFPDPVVRPGGRSILKPSDW